MKLRKQIFTGLFVLITCSLFAQTPTVKILTRPFEDSVQIRFAPSDAILWKYGNKYGYRIEHMKTPKSLDGKSLS